MDERAPCGGDLERQHLIERLEVAALVQDVDSQSDADREVGHDEFGASRYSQCDLPVDRRGVERVAGIAASDLDDIIFGVDVGAAVVDAVQRETRAEFVAEVVHRREVEARHAVGVGRSVLLVADLHALAAPRSEQHQIVAEMAGEIGREKRPARFYERIVGPAETVEQAELHADRVESRIGKFGVAVREVGHRESRREIQLARERHVEVEIGVDVGVYLRPHHYVGRVHLRVVGFPAERQSEIPFVVERQPPAYPRDARPLENIECHGRAQLLPVFETVVGEPDSLIGASVYPVGTRSGLETERVAQVGGQRQVDRLPGQIVAREERIGRTYVFRAEFQPDTVDEAAAGECCRTVRAGVAVRFGTCVETACCGVSARLNGRNFRRILRRRVAAVFVRRLSGSGKTGQKEHAPRKKSGQSFPYCAIHNGLSPF